MIKMEEDKIQNIVNVESIKKDSGMERVDSALNKMLGKDPEATERIKNLF